MRAVLPVAGLGTRFLPVTSAVPKELLPLWDRPCAEFAVLEALDAGVEELIFVTARGKEALVAYFQGTPVMADRLEAAGRGDALAELRALTARARVVAVEQAEPLGLGHAVRCAAPHTGQEPFAVLLPDNVLVGPRPALAELRDAHEAHGGAVIGLEQVPEARRGHYGICEGPWADGRMQVDRVLEKPAPGSTTSRWAIAGRYVLPPDIHEQLDATGAGALGELQLSDALATLAAQGRVSGVPLSARRLDTGTPLGLLDATLHLALRDPTRAPEVRALLARHLGD